jgi:histidine triad (HIT) family protein
MPRSRGHSLVIPKQPAINMLDIEPASLCRVMQTVHFLAPVIMRAMRADGFMLQQFNEAAAGQMVFHIHFHIVPRFQDVPLKHAASEMEQSAILTANAEAIRAALAEQAG